MAASRLQDNLGIAPQVKAAIAAPEEAEKLAQRGGITGDIGSFIVAMHGPKPDRKLVERYTKLYVHSVGRFGCAAALINTQGGSMYGFGITPIANEDGRTPLVFGVKARLSAATDADPLKVVSRTGAIILPLAKGQLYDDDGTPNIGGDYRYMVVADVGQDTIETRGLLAYGADNLRRLLAAGVNHPASQYPLGEAWNDDIPRNESVFRLSALAIARANSEIAAWASL